MVVDDSSLQADSQPKSVAWSEGRRLLDAVLPTFITWTRVNSRNNLVVMWVTSHGEVKITVRCSYWKSFTWWQHYRYYPGYYYYYYIPPSGLVSRLIPPPRRLCFCFGVFVCQQFNSESCRRIFTKLFGWVASWMCTTSNKPLDCGGYREDDADP